MKITEDAVVEHASTFARVFQLIADVADFRALRAPDVVTAGVRAALAGLADLLDNKDTVTPAHIDKRLADLRRELDLVDARHDNQLNLKFD